MSAAPPVSFDVDGVLVDTRGLVRRAYEEAGVVLGDDEFDRVWGLPWHLWLPDRFGGSVPLATVAHRAKNRAYARILETSVLPTLPPLDVIRELLSHTASVRLLTGMSRAAADVVLAQLRLPTTLLAMTGAAPADKLAWCGSRPPRHVHLDDDERVVRLLLAGRCNVIHYTGQPAAELREALSWTP